MICTINDSKFRITIITVVYNDVSHIEQTIASVIDQSYSDKEYIIIDGGSTDGTIDIIKKYQNQISFWKSEPDNGIYDAMNKALEYSHGEWVIFMNSGDMFHDDNVLLNIFSLQIGRDIEFLYSDFIVKCKNKYNLHAASFSKGILLHQSVIYKRKLHDRIGKYIVTKRYMVSDYMFFMQVHDTEIYKVPYVISVSQEAGISAGSWCRYQKYCCDFLFSKITIYTLLYQLVDSLLKNNIKRILNKK